MGHGRAHRCRGSRSANIARHLGQADKVGPIAKSFWANEEMGDLILDGVVCVVDCRNVLKVSRHIEEQSVLIIQQLSETKEASKEANDCQKYVFAVW